MLFVIIFYSLVVIKKYMAGSYVYFVLFSVKLCQYYGTREAIVILEQILFYEKGAFLRSFLLSQELLIKSRVYYLRKTTFPQNIFYHEVYFTLYFETYF